MSKEFKRRQPAQLLPG